MKNLTKILTVLAIAITIASCQKDQINSSEEVQVPQEEETHNRKHRCGMDAVMEKLMADPEFAREHAEKMEASMALSKTTALSSTVTLPVAVHFRGIGNQNRNCLAAIATQQINKLNEDFGALNADKSIFLSMSNYFPGINLKSSKIKFELATKNHPTGYSIPNGQPAITINKTSGQTISKFKNYINIVVQPNTGILGESPLGGSGKGDFISVDAAAFGLGATCGPVGAQSPYNKGRTLVHEVGHYFLLDHIWGNGCGTDDGVNDTPPQKQPYYGTPTAGKTSCNSYDLYPNYMDYVDDKAMVMFSQGQVNRMENYVSANLQHVITKGNSVLASGSGTSGGGSTGGGTTGGSNTTKKAYEIRLKLDDYGSETSWEIRRRSNNKLIARGKNYKDWQMNQVKKKTVQLAPGQYKLIYKDSYGDGNCCTYGSGSIALHRKSNNKRIFRKNGRFGYSKRINFNISATSARVGDVVEDQPQYRGVKTKQDRVND